MIRLIKRILRLALLLFLGAGLALSYARWVEPRSICETKLILEGGASCVLEDGEGLRIAVFSDVHFNEYYTPEDFSRAVTKINAMKPDLVFFLGDLIDHYNVYTGDTALISQALSQIETSGRTGAFLKDGTLCDRFAVFGNHDYGGGLENYYERIMKDGGFCVLVNETATLYNCNVTVTGIDDVIIGYGDVTCPSVLSNQSYNIVLAHEPDVITQMTDYPIDLMLSGHTHGGQVNLPPVSHRFLPAYGELFQSGEYRFDNERATLLYVSRGLGTTKLPLRFMAPPELTDILLK